MQLGVGVGNVDAALARRAEELGCTHAWFVDSPNFADMAVTMTAGALATKKIMLGPGVAVPTTRSEYVMANAMASLNRLAPGRIVYAVGTGFTARLGLGSRPLKLEQLRHHVEVVRGLMRGDTVEWDWEGRRRKVRLLNPDIGLVAVEPKIPVHISAFAPKAMALAAELGDGWHSFINGDHASVCRAVHQFSEALVKAGRDPVGFPKVAWTLGCVLEEGEPADSPRALAQAGPQAAAFLHGAADGTIPDLLPGNVREAVKEYRKIYDAFQPSDAKWLQNHCRHMIAVNSWDRQFLTPGLIETTAFVGTAPALARRLREMEHAGWTQLAILIPPGQEAAIEDWARVRDMANSRAEFGS
jgi:5,10-methylenetetrahydromethanopterin reductase